MMADMAGKTALIPVSATSPRASWRAWARRW
jgi:hypothetical protein